MVHYYSYSHFYFSLKLQSSAKDITLKTLKASTKQDKVRWVCFYMEHCVW